MNYNFFVATPTDYNDHKVRCLENSSIDLDTNTMVKYHNKQGLPKVYNDFIKSHEWENEDRIVFLHDDLHIHDTNIIEKLDDAHKKFDIVGLAGSGGNIKKNDIAMWHLLCDKRSGTITHTDGNKYWTNVYGENGLSCKFLDGLFLSINPSKMIEKDVWFDEDFTFNHYDSSFSVRAVLAGLTLGTPDCPIFVIHEGLGEMTEEFYKSNDLFKKKYYML